MSVTTEVQRTLVKSPPELWAELSDPAALSRHLSDLGEVRVTRIEPEQSVEWQATAADGTQASGKVEISPAGWGTKVTFSATRAAAANPTPPGPELQGEPAATQAMAETLPANEAISDDDPFAEDPSTEDPPDDHLLADEDLLTDDDPFADEDPLADDDLQDDDGFPSDDDLVAEEKLPAEAAVEEGPLAGEGPLAEWTPPAAYDAFAERLEPDPEPDGEPAGSRRQTFGSHAPPERRRGFFARLFGFGGLQKPDALSAPDTLEARYESSEDAAALLPPPELPSSVAMAEQVTQSYESVGIEPPLGPGSVPPAYDDPPADELGALAEIAPDATAPEATAPEATAPDATELAEPFRAPHSETDAAETDASLTHASAPQQSAVEQTPDIAGELQAAEEVAGEKVKAVLTSALDSLGAAHHRPFSRA